MKATSAKKAVPQPPTQVATADEVWRAVETLTEVDLLRLHEEARCRVIRIGPCAANGRTDDDLLQDAVIRLLDGKRSWYPENVPFVPYLMGVIKSVASAWAGHRERNSGTPEYAALETELMREDEEGNKVSPFDAVPASTPNIEAQTIEAEMEAEYKTLADEIEASCTGDEDASMVILGWQSDMNGPDIQAEFGWSETTYRTTVRRIQRRAQKIARRHYGR